MADTEKKTIDPAVLRAMAVALHRTDPELADADAEASKAAWEANKNAYRKRARRIILRVSAAGHM